MLFNHAASQPEALGQDWDLVSVVIRANGPLNAEFLHQSVKCWRAEGPHWFTRLWRQATSKRRTSAWCLEN